ncbi:probable cytochrome P450 49a1 [Homarus americanus]|uniref:Cytochrome P450 49a1-like 3 n=1 Tax=Homarus americanus TaxID=6706 RepID=A0A8J5JLT9_HOMAM|nr:probable cytochrome P450 49a1 [Homarus americanus]KAG7158381.1 cytochrome P450 49a1-like 3 [Homarus americanus]
MSSVLRCRAVQALRCSSILQARAFTVTAAPNQVAAKAEGIIGEEQKVAARPVSEVPGPRKYPILGTVPSMLIDDSFKSKQLHHYFEKIVKMYGPIVQIHSPFNPPAVIIVNPDDCEIMLRATMENPIRDGFHSLKKIRQNAVDNYFNHKTGLLSENGEEWWRVRSRVQTSMMKPKNVVSYLPEMDQITLDFMERIAYLQSQHGEMPSDFQNEIYKWALESVGIVALNRRLGCLDPNITEESEPIKLINLVNEIFIDINHLEFNLHIWEVFPTPTYKKLKNNHEEFLKLADRNIRETEASLLAQAPDDDRELTLMEALLLKPGLTRKDVVTLILDMLFAGIDTTSHTLGFTLYLLARNPEVQARLQEEVDTVLGDHQGPLTPKHLAQLSYLKAVIKESMRIFPIVIGVGRTLDKDVVLSGFLVPKGWAAFAISRVMNLDESLFPRPKEFIPERWLRHKPLGPIHPYAFLPFGAGTRMCIGRRIAEQEMYTFLTRVMQRFTVDYQYEDIDMVCKLVFTPSQPLKFSFTERR